MFFKIFCFSLTVSSDVVYVTKSVYLVFTTHKIDILPGDKASRRARRIVHESLLNLLNLFVCVKLVKGTLNNLSKWA